MMMLRVLFIARRMMTTVYVIEGEGVGHADWHT